MSTYLIEIFIELEEKNRNFLRLPKVINYSKCNCMSLSLTRFAKLGLENCPLSPIPRVFAPPAPALKLNAYNALPALYLKTDCALRALKTDNALPALKFKTDNAAPAFKLKPDTALPALNLKTDNAPPSLKLKPYSALPPLKRKTKSAPSELKLKTEIPGIQVIYVGYPSRNL